MKTVSGYVLVKETNSGIPHLVVEAYDARGHDEAGAEHHANTRSPRNLGRRLGSVLTGADGRFVLTTADLEFEGNDARPNLMIAVYAPEDVRASDAPSPEAPERVMLFVSAVPRFQAGAEEAFVIRLLRAQIVRLEIPLNAASVRGGADVSRVAGAIESTWDLRDGLKQRLSARLQAEHAVAQKRRDAAALHVADLSAIPRHLRGGAGKNGGLRSDDLLINGKKELSGNLKRLQTRAVSDGLNRFGRNPNKPTVRLHLTDQELADIGLTVKDEKLEGTIDSTALAATARRLAGGLDLVRVRGIDNPSPDELERRYLSPSPPAASVNE